jgi:hypothetical protein
MPRTRRNGAQNGTDRLVLHLGSLVEHRKHLVAVAGDNGANLDSLEP